MSHGDDDDGDDAKLRSLRAVWLSMPDEDPPERGLDALMAAARTKAAEMAEGSTELPKQPTWWERFFATLRRPQVLALATVILLFAGALIVTDRGMKASAPSNSATPSSEDVSTERREHESLKDNAPPPAAVDKKTPGGAAGNQHLAAPEVPNEGAVKESATKGEDAVVTGQWQAVPMDGRTSSEELAKNKLFDEAKTAAVKGDCNSARTVARQLEQQDLSFYRSRVVPDPSISECINGRATGGATATDRATTAQPSD